MHTCSSLWTTQQRESHGNQRSLNQHDLDTSQQRSAKWHHPSLLCDLHVTGWYCDTEHLFHPADYQYLGLETFHNVQLHSAGRNSGIGSLCFLCASQHTPRWLIYHLFFIATTQSLHYFLCYSSNWSSSECGCTGSRSHCAYSHLVPSCTRA